MSTKTRQVILFETKDDDTAVRGCLSIGRLVDLSTGDINALPSAELKHVERCPRCASHFMTLNAGHTLAALPDRWTVHVGASLRQRSEDSDDSTLQVLGHIRLESRDFTSCREDEWTSSPIAMRVNLVIDLEMQVFSLTVLDVPIGIERIGLMTASGIQFLKSEEATSAFSLLIFGGEERDEEVFVTFSELCTQLSAFKLQLVFDMSDLSADGSQHEATDILDVLEQHQAVERCADYILPCGLHSNTYINSAALCSREESMQLIAAKADFLLSDVQFDTILSNGWAMDLIARRLAATRRAQGREAPLRQVMCEGYGEPVLMQDIIPGSQVLIVLDVVVTGRLAAELKRLVQAASSDVVGILALVRPHGIEQTQGPKVRTLCEIEMDLVDPHHAKCPRCGVLPQQEFNPVAGCMTTKCSSSRSPSQFLNEDSSARELWEYVKKTQAYEHHRKEGDTHYIGFVDTRKLLEAKKIGKALVERLTNVVANSGNTPNVLLVPNRARAELLAEKMSLAIGAHVGARPRLVKASRKWSTGQWELPEDEREHIRDADVLIVDTAAGHGRTIDQLGTIANEADARRVGAAVLLSRLTPPCEDAFNLRLSGGYHRLFNLPIRPVAIRGDRTDLCPICRRKTALRRFVEESDIASLEEWADSLLKSRRGPKRPIRRKSQRQLDLFPEECTFLSDCGSAVASGITLHALGAAGTNGSAPLSLPELFDERIPWRSRATMVENLPPGILEWTGDTLVADLSNVLANGDYLAIWKATANLLSREGNNVWLDHLEAMVGRMTQRKLRTSPSFWNHMACNAYLLATNGKSERIEVQARIEELLGRLTDDVVQDGLRQMQEVIAE
jgi:orotate phosphoribosyltransferase